MTKVAGIPEQMRAAAGALHATAGDLQRLGSQVASVSYPEMPAGTEATVRALVTSAASRLQRDAIVAEAAGGDIHKRAGFLDAANELLTSPVLRGPKGAGEALLNSLDLVERRKVAQMLSEWARWERVVTPIVTDYGDDSLAATTAWFLFQRRSPLTVQQILKMVSGAGEQEAYAAAADVPLAAVRTVGGKILGPLGIYTNFLAMTHPEHEGWRGTGDQVAGGIGLGGSIGATALAFGAAVPGLDVAVGVALLGAGAWELGNLAWDNRKAIAKAATTAGKFAVDHAPDFAAGAVAGPAGVFAWEHRGDIARGAVATATWGADQAESAASTALSTANDLLDKGGSVASTLTGGLL